MTFDLTTIAVFSVAAVIYNALLPRHWRGWTLMTGSVIAIYWLQPPIVVGRLDFAFPTATVALTVALWWFTYVAEEKPRHHNETEDINDAYGQDTFPDADEQEEPETSSRRIWGIFPRLKWKRGQGHQDNENLIAVLVIFTLVIGMSCMRFIDADYRLTPSYTPHPLTVAVWLGIAGYFTIVLRLLFRVMRPGQVMALLMLVVIAIFAVLKTESLALELSRFFREQAGRDPTLASTLDLNWLGFSYVAFRLIHTLRDRQTGKLPSLSLREFMTYVIFFPSFTAGPIDRAERFVKDFRALPEKVGMDPARYTEGTTRIMTGIFKKFVVADSLAMGMALNASNADQATSTLGLWVLLYGYTLRLFFDFSGYSDIAIGIGVLFGVKLPENFDRPYLKNNITVFWQSWHMTLSSWARFYVFMPFSRFLLTRQPKPSPTVIVLLSQMATMVVIGLWHGVTVNFVVWGVWHGVGLFIHKQWTDRTRKWYRELAPARKQAWTVFGWFTTLQFVVLGWVWFALPEIEQSGQVFARLFGIGW